MPANCAISSRLPLSISCILLRIYSEWALALLFFSSLCWTCLGRNNNCRGCFFSFHFLVTTPHYLLSSRLVWGRLETIRTWEYCFLRALLTASDWTDYFAFVTLLAQQCGPRSYFPLLRALHRRLWLCLQATGASPTTTQSPQTRQKPGRLLWKRCSRLLGMGITSEFCRHALEITPI